MKSKECGVQAMLLLYSACARLLSLSLYGCTDVGGGRDGFGSRKSGIVTDT